jgi:hypothetical protein
MKTKSNRIYKNKTRKHGGDITKKGVYKKILSIGYELESNGLAKLSFIEDSILINTDTKTNDYETIKNIQNNKGTEEDEDIYENRLNELMEIDIYTSESIKNNELSKDTNSEFLITNDISVNSAFGKRLNKYCRLDDDDEVDDEIEDAMQDKNELYRFETNDGKNVYDIKFEMFSKNKCSTFSNVEWVITYYKPQISRNIIVDTFINVIDNILLHVNKLTETTGKFIIKLEDTDVVINHPELRKLYNLPDTNLYYLQTHITNKELENTEFNIYDVCVVPQMTFSCHIYDIVNVLQEMSRDNIKIFTNMTQLLEDRLTIINNLEKCVNDLIKEYNENEPLKIIEKKDKKLVKSIKNYIFLILFKLHRYYNAYLVDEDYKNKKPGKYFKNFLFYNSRHSNYELYTLLKQHISQYFSNKVSSPEVIKKIILQPAILEKYLLEDGKIRKNGFLISNVVEKKHKKYGDPQYSLSSYFDFFEDPINDYSNDWLEYADIDTYSSRNTVNNDIVLTEIRNFTELLSSYIYNMADNDLKNEMTHGICNKMFKKFDPTIRGLSFTVLKKFSELYKSTQSNESKKSKKSKK